VSGLRQNPNFRLFIDAFERLKKTVQDIDNITIKHLELQSSNRQLRRFNQNSINVFDILADGNCASYRVIHYHRMAMAR